MGRRAHFKVSDFIPSGGFWGIFKTLVFDWWQEKKRQEGEKSSSDGSGGLQGGTYLPDINVNLQQRWLDSSQNEVDLVQNGIIVAHIKDRNLEDNPFKSWVTGENLISRCANKSHVDKKP